MKPRLKIGDTFFERGQYWEVVKEPIWENSAEGEQWWYPSRVVGQFNIKESDIEFHEEE